jgi:hypothetical protein
MAVKDNETLSIIDRISEHFRTNLNNRYVRQAYSVMPLDQGTWTLIEAITEKSEHYSGQGYSYHELYDRILALARFVYHARREVQPHLRSILSRKSGYGGGAAAANDRVLREISVNNFPSNLNLLADLIDRLYQHVAMVDQKEHKNQPPVYRGIRELNELGRYLVPK